MRESSESPQPVQLPPVSSHDFADEASGNQPVKVEHFDVEGEDEDDEDMEEVDVVGLQTDGEGSVAEANDINLPEAAALTPAEASNRRSGRERKTRIAVDNPYEESDEDDEKGIVDAEGVMENPLQGVREDDSGDSMDEVDFAPIEPPPKPIPQTTRSGRTIKLRIGPVKEEPETKEVGGKRVTRSSKRKR